MCAIKMDLTKNENLNFAIYNLILQQGKAEFTEACIINQLKTYSEIPDDTILEQSVKNFINFWVKRELLQQHWDTYSLA